MDEYLPLFHHPEIWRLIYMRNNYLINEIKLNEKLLKAISHSDLPIFLMDHFLL